MQVKANKLDSFNEIMLRPNNYFIFCLELCTYVHVYMVYIGQIKGRDICLKVVVNFLFIKFSNHHIWVFSNRTVA